MRKTAVLAVIFGFMFSMSLSALNAKGGITVRGGSTMLSPSSFNDDYTTGYGLVYPELWASAAANGLDLTSDPLEGFFPQINVEAKFFPMENLGILLRGDFTTAEASTTLSMDGEEVFDNHVAFEFMYAGIGARYYIPIPGVKGFHPYVGADGGAFFHLNSFWQVWADAENTVIQDYLGPMPEEGDNYPYSQTADFTDMFFGGNVEAGIEYLFDGTIGLNVGAGYRIASSPINVEFRNTATGNTLTMSSDSANLGGLYALAGVSFYFGGEKAAAGAAETEAAAQQPDKAAKYEKYGNYYYKKKNFKYAVRYFTAAAKLAPSAALYKKIGFCYYYMKQKEKAMYYLNKYLEMNPNDTRIRNWLGK